MSATKKSYQITSESGCHNGNVVQRPKRRQRVFRNREKGEQLRAEVQPDPREPERPEKRGDPDPRPLCLQKGVKAKVGDVLPLGLDVLGSSFNVTI